MAEDARGVSGSADQLRAVGASVLTRASVAEAWDHNGSNDEKLGASTTMPAKSKGLLRRERKKLKKVSMVAMCDESESTATPCIPAACGSSQILTSADVAFQCSAANMESKLRDEVEYHKSKYVQCKQRLQKSNLKLLAAREQINSLGRLYGDGCGSWSSMSSQMSLQMLAMLQAKVARSSRTRMAKTVTWIIGMAWDRGRELNRYYRTIAPWDPIRGWLGVRNRQKLVVCIEARELKFCMKTEEMSDEDAQLLLGFKPTPQDVWVLPWAERMPRLGWLSTSAAATTS